MIGQVNYAVFVAAFSLYTLAVIAVGLYSARYARKSDEDYFLAGRSLGKWVAALSASASSESGWVTLGLVGMGFTLGVRAYWMLPGCLIGYSFIWLVLAARMRQRAGDIHAVTLPDFFAQHFQERIPLLRTLSVVVILVAMLLYVAAQFNAAGKAFAASFPSVNYPTGVLIGAVIVLGYTVSGGFRAVCWTDYLQALLMLVALVVFPVYVLVQLGGYGPTLALLEQSDPVLLQFWPDLKGLPLVGFLLGVSALGINFGYAGQPHVLVRFMALRDTRDVKQASAIAIIWVLIVLWGAVTAGIGVRALTIAGAEWGQPLLESGEMAERALVVGSIHVFPEILAGLALAAVLAAIFSTADSQLVVAASAAASDFYGRLVSRNSGRNHVWLDRLVVFLLGVGAVLLVIREDVKVFKFVLEYGWAILGAAFGPQVILILLWRRASYAGCLAGMVVGFALPILWKRYYQPEWLGGAEFYNLTVGFLVAMATNIVFSLLVPGRPAAAAAGDDADRPAGLRNAKSTS